MMHSALDTIQENGDYNNRQNSDKDIDVIKRIPKQKWDIDAIAQEYY